MSISPEELQNLLDAAATMHRGTAALVEKAAAEVIALRARVAAADALAEQVRYIAQTPDIDGYEPGMWAINRSRSAIAAYEAAQ